MYKFKATQFYVVQSGDIHVKFDYFGEFKTEDAVVGKALKKLVPQYIQLVEEPKVVPHKETVTEEVVVDAVGESADKAEDEPAVKPQKKASK